eukprot:m.130683 g.130683  ORF g.130683 m.130683 type:complete len:308 (-) comp16440_c2_seq1:1585-2508(-)
MQRSMVKDKAGDPQTYLDHTCMKKGERSSTNDQINSPTPTQPQTPTHIHTQTHPRSREDLDAAAQVLQEAQGIRVRLQRRDAMLVLLHDLGLDDALEPLARVKLLQHVDDAEEVQRGGAFLRAGPAQAQRVDVLGLELVANDARLHLAASSAARAVGRAVVDAEEERVVHDAFGLQEGDVKGGGVGQQPLALRAERHRPPQIHVFERALKVVGELRARLAVDVRALEVVDLVDLEVCGVEPDVLHDDKREWAGALAADLVEAAEAGEQTALGQLHVLDVAVEDGAEQVALLRWHRLDDKAPVARRRH